MHTFLAVGTVLPGKLCIPGVRSRWFHAVEEADRQRLASGVGTLIIYARILRVLARRKEYCEQDASGTRPFLRELVGCVLTHHSDRFRIAVSPGPCAGTHPASTTRILDRVQFGIGLRWVDVGRARHESSYDGPLSDVGVRTWPGTSFTFPRNRGWTTTAGSRRRRRSVCCRSCSRRRR